MKTFVSILSILLILVSPAILDAQVVCEPVECGTACGIGVNLGTAIIKNLSATEKYYLCISKAFLDYGSGCFRLVGGTMTAGLNPSGMPGSTYSQGVNFGVDGCCALFAGEKNAVIKIPYSTNDNCTSIAGYVSIECHGICMGNVSLTNDQFQVSIGTVTANTPASVDIRVRNDGQAPARIYAVRVEPDDYQTQWTFSPDPWQGIDIAKGATVTITATLIAAGPRRIDDYPSFRYRSCLDGEVNVGTHIVGQVEDVPKQYHSISISTNATATELALDPPDADNKRNVSNGTVKYERYSTVTVTAPDVSPDGKKFVRFILDGIDESNNPITIVMDSDHSLQAVYGTTVTSHDLSFASLSPIRVRILPPDVHGNTEFITPCKFNVEENTDVTITVDNTSQTGEIFVRCELDGQQYTVPTMTVRMDADKQVIVHTKPAAARRSIIAPVKVYAPVPDPLTIAIQIEENGGPATNIPVTVEDGFQKRSYELGWTDGNGMITFRRAIGSDTPGFYRLTYSVENATPVSTRIIVRKANPAPHAWEKTSDPVASNPGVFRIAMDSTGRLYGGHSGSGLWISDDDGTTWSATPIQSGTVRSLAVTPDNRVFAGVDGQGLFISTDRGESFRNILATDAVMWSILYTSTGRLFTGSNQSLQFSDDNGATWRPARGFPGAPFSSATMALHETAGGKILAGGFTGVWMSPDGETFSDAHSPYYSTTACNCIQDISGNTSAVYVSHGNDGIFRSVDEGASWERIKSKPGPSYWGPVRTVGGSTVYAASDGLSFSDDGGHSWNSDAAGLPWMIQDILVTPSGSIFAASENGLYRSTWTPAVQKAPKMSINAALDFGSTKASGIVTRSIVISNTGNEVLTLLSQGVTGTGFTLSSAVAPMIAPGSSGQAELVFNPASPGEYNGAFTVQSNDPTAASVRVILTGKCVETAPRISAEKQSVFFGDVNVGNQKETSLVLNNLGNAELLLQQSSIEGEHASEFSIVNSAASPILPGWSSGYWLRCMPTSTGPKVAMLSIRSNDPSMPTLKIPLTATASSPTSITDGSTVMHAPELCEVYPNPARTYATIRYRVPDTTPLSFQIVDSFGRVFYQSAFERIGSGTHSISVGTEMFPPGVYFCSLSTGSYSNTKLLLIVR